VDASGRFGHDLGVTEPPRIDDGCGVCRSIHGADRNPDEIVFENDLWHVRHGGAPYGVEGWMMLVTKSHTPGPWAFDDEEAASLGPTLRHLTSRLLEVTAAARIYTAWMGESWPHFHAHLVPRYANMPKDAKAWGVFDLQRAAGAGEITVDHAEVRRLTAAFRAVLGVSPPPR
jgi:diadenosine tetraphosphate (Ap4A) HIT family hydrolase